MTLTDLPNIGKTIAADLMAIGLQTPADLEGRDALAIFNDLKPVMGQTALAFAAHELGTANLPDGYIKADQSAVPLGMEIALVTEDVGAAHAKAVAAGATSIKEPMIKPWGQTVSYVRCPDGTLVELCTPVTG